MGKASFQPNVHDPRWGEVRALLPSVRRWLGLLGELIGIDESTSQVEPLDEASRGALAVLNELADTTIDDNEQDPKIDRPTSGRPLEEMDSRADRRRTRRAALEGFEACQSKLLPKQWTVVCMHFGEGKSLSEIAAELGKSRSAVWGLKNRAEAVKDAYLRALRAERAEFVRENLNLR